MRHSSTLPTTFKLTLLLPDPVYMNVVGFQVTLLFFVVAYLNVLTFALAGVAQWIEHWPANPKVAGSILSQGTCLGCRPGPQ